MTLPCLSIWRHRLVSNALYHTKQFQIVAPWIDEYTSISLTRISWLLSVSFARHLRAILLSYLVYLAIEVQLHKCSLAENREPSRRSLRARERGPWEWEKGRVRSRGLVLRERPVNEIATHEASEIPRRGQWGGGRRERPKCFFPRNASLSKA